MHSSNNTHAQHYVALILPLLGLISAFIVAVGPARHASAQAVAPSWSYTGSLNEARGFHTATLLPNGKVLVAGGSDLKSAELYDPRTGVWSSTGNLNAARSEHAATLLPNGKILVAGGTVGGPEDVVIVYSAELYDPATGTWSNAGNSYFGFARTATLLPNGKVLVGGDLFDPASGIWSNTGNRNTGGTATLLQNGKVLVTGTPDFRGTPRGADLYDSSTGTWSTTGNLNAGRSQHTATLLPNGKVLIAGGDDYLGGFFHKFNSAEVYDPATGTWSFTGNLNDARGSHTATLLPNGKVLVTGGFNDTELPKRTELYDPATGTWSITASLNQTRVYHTATLLPSGKVLVVDGSGDSTAELYDPGTSATPNQIDDVQFFVRQHYRDFLNREPDADGLAFWTNEITLCGGEAQCVEVKRINDSASFFLSIEFQETGYLVYRFYKAPYGNLPNAPVPIKLAEFLPDTQEIGKNVIVKQAGWEQVLENNKQAFAAAFVQRQRFVSAYPTTLSPDTFVDALFTNAGVTPSSSDHASTIAEFGGASNTADVAARARALRRIAENSAFAQQEFNRAFVLMQYFGYLRRNPNDAPDGNFDGYNFWLTKLNQFNGNYIQAEMVKAFLSSIEYRHRFGP